MISDDTIICPECYHPTQKDLTETDATFVQEIATSDPEALKEAIDRARQAVAAKAAAEGHSSEDLLDRSAPQDPPKSATNVAGVRFEVGKSKQKLRSKQATLSGKWKKYHNTSRNRYE